eukprot:Gregarina_sp_Poly_1__5587@NODE_294_length_9872_cov_66_125038_g254_i0_p7_GENE_NODE_294_length_9872_cov_66_125038_g254_i0NODE_294_length_9872_cov_66_125038_g254_i0_p7_ORF_typecomplete_len135_score13_91An_peroxidase/PF03098_15/0_022_NODE_294_length_9872_cov_66_125038_g254_i047055109
MFTNPLENVGSFMREGVAKLSEEMMGNMIESLLANQDNAVTQLQELQKVCFAYVLDLMSINVVEYRQVGAESFNDSILSPREAICCDSRISRVIVSSNPTVVRQQNGTSRFRQSQITSGGRRLNIFGQLEAVKN